MGIEVSWRHPRKSSAVANATPDVTPWQEYSLDSDQATKPLPWRNLMFNWPAHFSASSSKKFAICAELSSTLEKVALFLVILGLLVPVFVK